MRRAWQLALLLVLIGAAILVWRQLFPSPEQLIRKRMVQLQKLVSFHSSEGNFSALTAREQLGALFAEDAQVRLEARSSPRISLNGRLEIMNAFLAARRELVQLEVEFLDVVVTLAADEGSAVVEVTGTARQTPDDELWVQVLQFKFTATDDGWLISSVEALPLVGLCGRAGFPFAPAVTGA